MNEEIEPMKQELDGEAIAYPPTRWLRFRNRVRRIFGKEPIVRHGYVYYLNDPIVLNPGECMQIELALSQDGVRAILEQPVQTPEEVYQRLLRIEEIHSAVLWHEVLVTRFALHLVGVLLGFCILIHATALFNTIAGSAVMVLNVFLFVMTIFALQKSKRID